MDGPRGQAALTSEKSTIFTRYVVFNNLDDPPSQIQILLIASQICSRMDAEAPVSMVMGRLAHCTPSVGDAENWLRIERCRSGTQGKKGSMRKPGLRDRTSLELQMRLHSRLVPVSLTASLGHPNPGEEAQPLQTQARLQAGSLSPGCVCGEGGILSFHLPFASQPSVPAWGPRSWTLPGSMKLSSQQGAESPSAEGAPKCSHPLLQGYFQLTGCKGAVGGFQDRRRVLAGAGNH